MLNDPTPEQFARDRDWRARAARRYADKRAGERRSIPTPEGAFSRANGEALARLQRRAGIPVKKPAKTPKRRSSDGPWRDACIAAYGDRCIVPGCGDRAIEMDHIKPRAQGGRSVVENGLPLCGSWSRTIDGGHHLAKTQGRLRFRPEWLTAAQQTYLAQIGWVDWDEEGQPFGEGWRHFEERTAS